MTGAPGDSYRVLLVGIDAYEERPLDGCVNDIDAVQELLLDKVGIPPERIRRLASPAPGTPRSTRLPEEPATRANLRRALAALAEEARPGDRVFIYYSGHGVRAEVQGLDGRTFHREALVPVDFNERRDAALLLDYELDELLGRITARTRAVTVVLDCCHSAGVTRGPEEDMTPRSFVLAEVRGPSAPIRAPMESRPATALPRASDTCHVISACQHHERAYEARADGGVPHGLLTRAFLRAVAEVTDVALGELTWARIWQAVRGAVEDRTPTQHPWMDGSAARAVFGGAPVDDDPGYPIRRDGDEYAIGAGTLVGVTQDALVAVYGELPARFPPLGSQEDRDARCGLLRVRRATISAAAAAAEGADFDLPYGARGRLVAAGEPARLRCAVVPRDPKLVAALAASPLLQVVEPAASQVRLARAGDRWLLADDLHLENPATALFALTADQLPRARHVLEHYFRYSQPLRLAQAVGTTGMLELHLLACSGRISPQAAQEGALPEAPTVARSLYEVPDGFLVCFRVRNTSTQRLRVTLVNSAGSGRVQLLGDTIIDAGSAHVFWAGGLGKPFAMTIVGDRRQTIDRLTAIGTNALEKGVSFLLSDEGFAQAVAVTRGVFAATRGTDDKGKDIGGALRMPPAEQWTAAQIVVKTRGLPRPGG